MFWEHWKKLLDRGSFLIVPRMPKSLQILSQTTWNQSGMYHIMGILLSCKIEILWILKANQRGINIDKQCYPYRLFKNFCWCFCCSFLSFKLGFCLFEQACVKTMSIVCATTFITSFLPVFYISRKLKA